MISPMVLEQPGRWRYALMLILTLPILPILPLALQAGSPATWSNVGPAFWLALANSLALAVLAGCAGWLIGLPLGVLAGAFRFPGRTIWSVLLALPLLVPSFLWAIGWMSLASRVGPWSRQVVEGWAGCVLVLSAGTISLTALAALAATRSITASAAEAARLAGGNTLLFRMCWRWAAIPAAVAALLGAIVTLADPGPGQILGVHTVASEMLTSFAASYDYPLASRQCLWITLVVLVAVTPTCALAAPRLVEQVLTRQVRPLRPSVPAHAVLASSGFAMVVSLTLLMPMVGLALPLAGAGDLYRAGQEILRTGGDTLLYAAGTAAVGCVLATALAIGVGRQSRLRMLTLSVSLVVFSLPPSMLALGMLALGTRSPASADWLFRSQATVALALGLRLLPVATLLALRAYGAMPASHTAASAISGVSLMKHVRLIVLPAMRPSLLAGGVLVALLATADVGTVLLLHPPGRPSLPLAVFTIMGNAPESLVAALCLLYLNSAAAILCLVMWRSGGRT